MAMDGLLGTKIIHVEFQRLPIIYADLEKINKDLFWKFKNLLVLLEIYDILVDS